MSNNETNQTTQKIIIVGTKSGAATRGPEQNIIEKAVDVKQIKDSFNRFLQNLEGIIDIEVPHVGSFELEEVSFTAEITANGDFKLIGVGFGIEAKGGVNFKLKHRNQKENN